MKHSKFFWIDCRIYATDDWKVALIKQYKYKNATVYIHGQIEKNKLEHATTMFLKKVVLHHKRKDRSNGNNDTSRIIRKK